MHAPRVNNGLVLQLRLAIYVHNILFNDYEVIMMSIEFFDGIGRVMADCVYFLGRGVYMYMYIGGCLS